MNKDTHVPCLTPAQFHELVKNMPQPQPTIRDVQKSFGAMLQSLRKKSSFSLRDLEQECDVPNPLISAIEHGRRGCSAKVAKKLADVLFGGSESKARNEFLYAAAATSKTKCIIKDAQLYPPAILDAVAEQLRRRKIFASHIKTVILEPKMDNNLKPDMLVLLKDGRRLFATVTITEEN